MKMLALLLVQVLLKSSLIRFSKVDKGTFRSSLLTSIDGEYLTRPAQKVTICYTAHRNDLMNISSYKFLGILFY